jgi:transmembrane sensor
MKVYPKEIDEAASRWLFLRQEGLTIEQEREFRRWLQSDHRHAETYHSQARAWRGLDELAGSPLARRLEAELDEKFAPESGNNLDFSQRKRSHYVPGIATAVAACLLFVAGYFAWWRPMQSSAPFADTAATPVGVIRQLDLPDGSIVRLNTDSALEVVFTKIERRVRLTRGEAFFTIAKNPARPFIVNAAGVDIRAIGTAFNVRLHSESVEVLVTGGKVRVDDAQLGTSLLSQTAAADADDPILHAGQRVRIPVVIPKAIPPPMQPTAVPPMEIERALAWQYRRLVFERAALSDIAAEFNRYNDQKVTVPDPELAARQFGGNFEANDLKTLLELLRTTYGVEIEERGAEIVLRGKR